MGDGTKLRFECQLREVGKIVEVEPGIHRNDVVLRRLQHLVVCVELPSMEVVDHKVRDLAVVQYEFGLERLGDFEGVAILVDRASTDGTKWTGRVTIGDVNWRLAPAVGGGDDQIGGMYGIGWTHELDQDLALLCTWQG